MVCACAPAATAAVGAPARGRPAVRRAARPVARRQCARAYMTGECAAMLGRAPSGCTRAQFALNGGVGYVRDFLPRQVFEELAERCEPAWRASCKQEKGSVAIGRRGRHLGPTTEAHAALMCEESLLFVSNLVGEPVFHGDFPVEYRLYTPGAEMDWHVDTVLYSPRPQYELVYTLSNDSDATTQWVTPDGKTHTQHMEPNSLLVLRAGGALHRVTPTTRGSRGILKALMRASVARTDAWYDCASTYSSAVGEAAKKKAARKSLRSARR